MFKNPQQFHGGIGRQVWCDRGMKEVRFAGREGMLGPHSLPSPPDPRKLCFYVIALAVCVENTRSVLTRTLQ
jgi:hypothetical protein